MYGASGNPWRFVSRSLCNSWADFLYYWQHGRLNPHATLLNQGNNNDNDDDDDDGGGGQAAKRIKSN
jgi:hypothetical protein